MSAAVRWFRIAAVAEAVSWVGLLIGMVFKYLVVENEIGVQIFGPVHGGVFIVYVLTVLAAARAERWRPSTWILGLVSSVPPLMTLWFERRVTPAERGSGPVPVS
ncbi:integral membrane protein [Haloactinopolyspora alba]|uniref:Integral membrane protein n=1 Tax=Haloactinopolyspora alba TaxID=648780 RepID=A0A2P8DYT7_9ACTN|nr:DUF3817 domain-containing protein [Haloactinopolyspora alba]PSL02382.1 integral membrane protein [Haloactinopolyspora alba]